jgi:predicted phosphoribosyltransferase
MRTFTDRREAGRLLAAELGEFAHRTDVIVLALPRGGVPVGYEVATALGLPLDVFVVRKIGAPHNEELAIGALASGGVVWLDQEMVRMAGATPAQVDAIIAKERAELDRREQEYREGAAPLDLKAKTVILVDDGLATGSTMLAAVQAVRERHPWRIVVAVPAASHEACARLRAERVECRCLVTPDLLFAVSAWYHDFTPTSDAEVRALLGHATNGRLTEPATR